MMKDHDMKIKEIHEFFSKDFQSLNIRYERKYENNFKRFNNGESSYDLEQGQYDEV